MSTFLQFIKKPKFQIYSVIITLLLVASLATIQYKKVSYAEKEYQITKLSKQEKRLSSCVDVGLFINNFPEFSFYKNKFIVDALVWFSFPIGTESLHTIENFTFQNGKIKYKSKPIIQLDNKTVTISYHVVIQFITHLNYTDFPLSDHKLNIVLENRSVTPNELYFSSTNESLTLGKNLLVSNWDAKGTYVKSGFMQSQLHRKDKENAIAYPCTVFTVDFENKTLGRFILLYFPLFLIFFIGFFSLLVSINDKNRLVIIASSAPMLVLNKLVINDLSPTTGSFTKIDKIYFLLICLSLSILIFQIYVIIANKHITELEESEQVEPLSKLINWNSIIALSVQIIIVLFMLQATIW